MSYKLKSIIGWTVLVVLSLIPAGLLIKLGPGISEFSSYSSATHIFGEIFGLVGMTLFALTFVLSTRIKWIEDVFGGLDKVYIVHGIIGGSALILILAHPIFLVLKFIPDQVSLAAKYLLPSSAWSVNFGIIALMGMIILIYITLYTKMKYHKWKFTHEFLGLMFILAVLHIFLVRGNASADNIFNGYYIYASVVSIIGICAFSYSLFLKNRIMKNAVYSISAIRQKNHFFEIEMNPEHKPIQYKSGQFIFVRFYNQNLSREAHPFSIASKSNDSTIRIIVKKLGDYTHKLEVLNIGDKVSIEGPYGRFNFHKSHRDQVWIAAGVGVTPFLGMAQDINKETKNKVELFYTVKDDKDFIGLRLLNEIASRYNNFKLFIWNSTKNGRLSVEEISKLSKNLDNKEFYLCGPEGFKESIINDLKKKGIPERRIHQEAFDFR